MPTTAGIDLKVERVRANVTVTDLAARMGTSRQTLWGIERSAAVAPERVRQYREALASIRDAIEAAHAAVA